MKKCKYYTTVQQNGQRAVILRNINRYNEDIMIIPRTPNKLERGIEEVMLNENNRHKYPEIVVSYISRSGLTRDLHVEGHWDIIYPMNIHLGQIDLFFLNISTKPTIVVTKRNEGVEVIDALISSPPIELYDIIYTNTETCIVPIPDDAQIIQINTKFFPKTIYIYNEKRVYPARKTKDNRILVAGYITLEKE